MGGVVGFRYVVDDPAGFRWDPPTGQWVLTEVPVNRAVARRLRRWILHPDQAPMTSVPVKGARR